MLFGWTIMPLHEFLGVMMLICIGLSIMSRKWLNNNPEVRDAAKGAAKSKLIDIIRKTLR